MSITDDAVEETRPPTVEETRLLTVAEALAMAEAWSERAALLAALASELPSLFGSTGKDRPPAYLIQRIAGGATAANPQVIDDIHAELLLAVKHARREACRILGSATDAPVDGLAPCLSGEGNIAPDADGFRMEVPTGGDELVGNAECPRARRTLGTRRLAVDVDEEAAPVAGVVRNRTIPTRRVGRAPGMEDG